MRRIVEARVPVPAQKWFTPLQWRRVIRAGMRYRRARRFVAEYRHHDRNGNVIVVEPNEWLDIGGEGGGGA